MTEQSKALTYTSYLALDEILGAQRPRSDEHDEMLFIVVHQVYELWFKELLHELAHLQRLLEETRGQQALGTFKRSLTILKLVVAQLDVIETLQPTQFLGFRDRLESASGFQSAQFRELEAVLGRRDRSVLRAYEEGSDDYRRIEAAHGRPSLYDSFLAYLSRRGYAVPAERLERDVSLPVEESAGVHAAILAAYRDDGEAAMVCERMVDFDEGFQEWRYRHVKMVERTIGSKPGTGGSPGAPYLHTTLNKPAFPDLWSVRSELVIEPEDLRRSPNALAADYSAFGVADRLLLTGHSHQAWPDVAREGQLEAFEDAALHVDEKWDRAFAKAEEVRDGFRRLLGEPDAEIALGQNTHELVIRFLSALDLRRRPRLITSDAEFHTLRRQLARLDEAGLEVVRLEAGPVETLAERIAAAIDERTSAVLVSAVLFETARIVPALDELATSCAAAGIEYLVDAYHALGALPFRVAEEGLESAWIVGGGYKYLQLGEGNCFMRLPPQADEMRPVLTGWFAEFELLAAERGDTTVGFPSGGARFAGSTYDPTSNYRAARVFAFFEERGLTPELLRDSYLHQTALLAARIDELDAQEEHMKRDRSAPLDRFGGFLAVECPQAGQVALRLAEEGVQIDARGRYFRLGPAPYLSDAQLHEAMNRLGAAAAALGLR